VGTGLAVVLIVALTALFASNRLAMAAAAAKLESAHAVIRGHKERMEEELRVGRDLQLSMVPRAVGTRDDVAVHAMLRPAPEGHGFTLEWPAEWETWYYRSFYPGTWEDIPHLDQSLPLLIIGGETSDTLSADSAARLREMLPRATHVTIPGGGHLFPQSHPDETRAILEQWLAGLR